MSYGKKFFKKNKDYKPLCKSLEKQVGKEKVTEIFDLAGKELDKIMSDFPCVPEGERNHTDNYIFPRVALYRVLKKEFGDNALGMIEEAVNIQGEKMGNLLRKFTALPFMEKIFLKNFSAAQ